jgi:hypothetical protein
MHSVINAEPRKCHYVYGPVCGDVHVLSEQEYGTMHYSCEQNERDKAMKWVKVVSKANEDMEEMITCCISSEVSTSVI